MNAPIDPDTILFLFIHQFRFWLMNVIKDN